MVKNNENAIREAAYYIWQNSGCPLGQDELFWSMAVEQVCGSCNKSSSTKKASSVAKKASTSSVKKTASCKASACKSSSSKKTSK